MSRFRSSDEIVRFSTRPHGAALVRPLARALVIAAAGGALVLVASGAAWPIAALGALIVAAGAFAALRAVVRWDRTRVVVTSQRLVVQHGVVRRRSAEVELPRGAPVEVEQSLIGRMLGYGTLIAGDLAVPYVAEARSRQLAG